MEYLPAHLQGYIITSFYYPQYPNFHFERFYRLLHEKGFTIYPGKVSNANCFRIGHIGHIVEADVQALIRAIGETLVELEIELQPIGANS